MITCGLESKFKPIVEDIIKRENEREYKEDVIEVTECVRCLRQAYYTRKYGNKVINKYIIEGRAIHLYFEHLIKKYGYNIESEEEYIVDFGLPFKIKMKPDVVMDDRVVDIKTTDRDNIFLSDIEYELQTNFYAFVLNKPYYEIVYITRGGGITVFVSEVNLDMFEEVLKRAVILYRCLKDNVEPHREPKYCRRCVFYHRCFKQKKLM